jgi:hypothetical protein
MFPFTPHTTLRPDYCSGGSFFTAVTAGARFYLLGRGLGVLAPDCRGEWAGSEWGHSFKF